MIAVGWREDAENAPHIASMNDHSEELGRILGTESDRPVGAELEEQEAVECWLRKLPKQHAEACRLIYVEGKTQGEAAAYLSCSKSRLSYLNKESIDFLNDVWASCPKARRDLVRYSS